MDLVLEKPIIFFDLEATGLNIVNDSIIEISLVKINTDNSQEIKTWKIKPWNYKTNSQVPITPSASAVNGIKDEDLKDCPKLIEVISDIANTLKGCDLAGFNSAKFDLPLLAEEFERIKDYCESRISDPKVSEEKKKKAKEVLSIVDIDFHNCLMVDIQSIYHFMEPRNLKAAYRFYCGGKDFNNAHSAEADTLATYEVLKGQLDMYSTPNNINNIILKNDIKSLAEINKRTKTVDFAGRIILKDGVPTISFGKHKDKTVKEIFEKERSYFSWIYNGEFSLDTKRQFKKLEDQYKQETEKETKKPATEEQLQLLLNLNTKKK